MNSVRYKSWSKRLFIASTVLEIVGVILFIVFLCMIEGDYNIFTKIRASIGVAELGVGALLPETIGIYYGAKLVEIGLIMDVIALFVRVGAAIMGSIEMKTAGSAFGTELSDRQIYTQQPAPQAEKASQKEGASPLGSFVRQTKNIQQPKPKPEKTSQEDASSVNFCPNCGYQFHMPKKYCPKCGNEVNISQINRFQEDKTSACYCKYCGYNNKVLVKYCLKCGKEQ